jgi:hypothetical protein
MVECSAAQHWVTLALSSLFGLVGVAYLVVMAFLWLTDLERPWRAQARAEEARQRGLDRLDRERRQRERAERPEVPEPFRRRSGNQPW